MLDLDRLNAILEVHDDAGNELGARGHLEMELAVDFLNVHAIAAGQVVLQSGIAGDDDNVAADPALESGGAVQGLNLAVVDNGDAAAILCLVQVVCRHEDGDAELVAET